MKTKKLVFLLCALSCLFAPSPFIRADQEEEPKEQDGLYTAPDPSASGGIRGSIAASRSRLEAVLAIPADNPAKVYQAELSKTEKNSFFIRGLPMDRYDLIVIYEEDFYEGLRLYREENSLTESDLAGIDDIIQRSEPFFTHKIIHRLDGSTGRKEEARAICTFYRDKAATAYMFTRKEGYRRTYKLVMLKDVGPGWQVVRMRDLFPVWTTPDKLRTKHHYSQALSGIRVTDSIRDLGLLRLGN